MKTPIYNFVKRYAQKDISRFHMPGHKGKAFLGCERCDITEISGADVLYSADGIIALSENNASSLFGTAHTFYSAEGSSLAIKAMLALAAENTEKPLFLAARNAHKAFIHAAALLDADINWIYPTCFSHPCVCRITADDVQAALNDTNQKPNAVFITSPDYLGNIADIKGIAEVCHSADVPLLVDNAHGAYLKFLETDTHPITLGADMCCDSAHKTLPVLTGGAYLHIGKNAERYVIRARDMLSVFASTSPSYLILQSLDICNKYLSGGYRGKLEKTVKKVSEVTERLNKNGYFTVCGEPLKIVINTAKSGVDTEKAVRSLRRYNIEPEFYDRDYLVLMASPENTARDFERLLSALPPIKNKKRAAALPPEFKKPKQVLSVRRAIFAECEKVNIDKAIRKICASPTVSCPPAVPIVVSGELIDTDITALLKYYGVTEINVIKE